MPNNIVAGLTQGHNSPMDKTMDLNDWNDVIIVDKEYFLEHIEELKNMALKIA